MASEIKCSRCGKPSSFKARGEKFCSDCYQVFISKKFRAEMGYFRVNGYISDDNLPKLLVFVSFGPSSLALVDLLVSMQHEQRKKYNGKVGFTFECVNIGIPAMPSWPWPEVPLRQLPPPRLPAEEDNRQNDRSTRHDLEGVLFRNAAISISVELGSTAVLGYSMTKLSELTLAETIKGRGATIPSIVSPDVIKDRVLYPLRDLTIPEIHSYVESRCLGNALLPEPVIPGITKMQSIDEIVRNYFADVQKDFPSVVSTVSKVAARLSQKSEPCALCQMDSITSSLSSKTPRTELCYACSSALKEQRLSQQLDILSQYEL